MLIITRKSGQSFFIGNDIEIKICDIQSDKIRIGINAPSDIPICRSEIKEVKDENIEASKTVSPEKISSINVFFKNKNNKKK